MGDAMKNILSYQSQPLMGAEIREWIEYHLEHYTEYSKIAYYMRRYLATIYDSRRYRIDLNPSGTACGEKRRYKPNLILLEEME